MCCIMCRVVAAEERKNPQFQDSMNNSGELTFEHRNSSNRMVSKQEQLELQQYMAHKKLSHTQKLKNERASRLQTKNQIKRNLQQLDLEIRSQHKHSSSQHRNKYYLNQSLCHNVSQSYQQSQDFDRARSSSANQNRAGRPRKEPRSQAKKQSASKQHGASNELSFEHHQQSQFVPQSPLTLEEKQSLLRYQYSDIAQKYLQDNACTQEKQDQVQLRSLCQNLNECLEIDDLTLSNSSEQNLRNVQQKLAREPVAAGQEDIQSSDLSSRQPAGGNANQDALLDDIRRIQQQYLEQKRMQQQKKRQEEDKSRTRAQPGPSPSSVVDQLGAGQLGAGQVVAAQGGFKKQKSDS